MYGSDLIDGFLGHQQAKAVVHPPAAQPRPAAGSGSSPQSQLTECVRAQDLLKHVLLELNCRGMECMSVPPTVSDEVGTGAPPPIPPHPRLRCTGRPPLRRRPPRASQRTFASRHCAISARSSSTSSPGRIRRTSGEIPLRPPPCGGRLSNVPRLARSERHQRQFLHMLTKTGSDFFADELVSTEEIMEHLSHPKEPPSRKVLLRFAKSLTPQDLDAYLTAVGSPDEMYRQHALGMDPQRAGRKATGVDGGVQTGAARLPLTPCDHPAAAAAHPRALRHSRCRRASQGGFGDFQHLPRPRHQGAVPVRRR